MSSDSQAMGRVGEVITRTWQTAHKMREQRGRLPEERGENDNSRFAGTWRSTPSTPPSPTASATSSARWRRGKLADLVLWKPGFFGIRPELVIKGGFIAWAQMGDAGASDSHAAAAAHAADVRARAPGPVQPRIRVTRAPRGGDRGARVAHLRPGDDPPLITSSGRMPKNPGFHSTRSASFPASTEADDVAKPWAMAGLMVYFATYLRILEFCRSLRAPPEAARAARASCAPSARCA